MTRDQIKILRDDEALEAATGEAGRLKIQKTYKIYLGGKFPRTESGRYYKIETPKTKNIYNLCLCSRKDVRDAVTAARGAQESWSKSSPYLRSQILYRMAEMLEGRKAQFIEEMIELGSTEEAARTEVLQSIDRLVYYAGWADKYQQVFSQVNPVAASYFNFSILEPTGVVGLIAPENSALLGLTTLIAPAIVGGNTVVVVASETKALVAVTLGEVLHSSDLPGGVVNILTGFRSELVPPLSTHMDVNALVVAEGSDHQKIQEASALNLKRVFVRDFKTWTEDGAEDPYLILDTQEVKTTWHPIGN